MNNIDAIFNDKAFDCLDDNVKNSLKKLYISIQGKSPEDALPYVMVFIKSLPKGIKLNNEQKQAIIKVVSSQMTEQEKKNLMFILKLFNF